MGAETKTRTGAPVIAAMSAAVFFGASVGTTRFVVGETGAVTLAFLRFAVGTACIAVIAVATGSLRIARNDIPATRALGALFFGVFPWLFSQSLLFIPASVRAIFVTLNPLAAVALAAVILGEEFRPIVALGLVLVLGRIVFVTLPTRASGWATIKTAPAPSIRRG